MPRPKGSKNKKSVAPVVEDIDQKIAAAEAEIEELGAQLKAKKAELKARENAEKARDVQAADYAVEKSMNELSRNLEESKSLYQM